MTEKTNNKPIKAFRAGAISVSIWKNEREKDGKTYEDYTVSCQRGYKDKEDQWKNCQSFRTADIPKLTMLLNMAFEYLVIRNEGQPE